MPRFRQLGERWEQKSAVACDPQLFLFPWKQLIQMRYSVQFKNSPETKPMTKYIQKWYKVLQHRRNSGKACARKACHMWRIYERFKTYRVKWGPFVCRNGPYAFREYVCWMNQLAIRLLPHKELRGITAGQELSNARKRKHQSHPQAVRNSGWLA